MLVLPILRRLSRERYDVIELPNPPELEAEYRAICCDFQHQTQNMVDAGQVLKIVESRAYREHLERLDALLRKGYFFPISTTEIEPAISVIDQLKRELCYRWPRAFTRHAPRAKAHALE